jgi:hypothetical protein
MGILSATTRVVKEGKSEHPFLLFFRCRRSEEKELATPLSSVITAFVLIAVVLALVVCLYAFLAGKLR